MDRAFDECTGIRELWIPASIEHLPGSPVFGGVKKVERLTLLGSTLSPGVVAIVKGCLMPMAKVIGPALVRQKAIASRSPPPERGGVEIVHSCALRLAARST
jgi:hypothetical protein